MTLVDKERECGMSAYDALVYVGIVAVILLGMSAYSMARQMLHCLFGHRRPKTEEQHTEGG